MLEFVAFIRYRYVMDWSTLRLRFGHFGRVRCEPGWSLGERWWRRQRDMNLWLVWAGRGRMILDAGRAITLRPGICLWMRPGHRYEATQQPDDRLGVTYTHFDLRHAETDQRIATSHLPAAVHEVDDLAYADGLTRRVQTLLRLGETGNAHAVTEDASPMHTVAGQLMRGLLMDLEAGLPRQAGASGTARHHEQVVERIAGRIREQPGEAPSVAELASEAGYSPDHLSRVFRDVLGLTPRDFIVAQRVERAKQLLAESALTVQQIADALGYSSVYFFSRQFKAKTGMSPTAYRQG